MNKAQIIVDADFSISQLDRRLFGSFVEHLGRCVYTGIFEPSHPPRTSTDFDRMYWNWCGNLVRRSSVTQEAISCRATTGRMG